MFTAIKSLAFFFVTVPHCRKAVDIFFVLLRTCLLATPTPLDDAALAAVESNVDKDLVAQRLSDWLHGVLPAEPHQVAAALAEKA